MESRAVVAGSIDGLTFTPDGSAPAAPFARRGGDIAAPPSGVRLWAVAAKK